LKSELIYRQLTAFIFLAAFLAQTFSRTFVIADYYTNTSKYTKNCENKARPKMHCNGKCQMMKKLQQEEKKDQENPERKAENKNEIILSTKSFFANVPTQYLIDSKSKKLLPSSDGKSIDRSFDIFHPPQA
jgi:hypothetical protein